MKLACTLLLFFFSCIAIASNQADIYRLKPAYPEQIQNIGKIHIRWHDGTIMAIRDGLTHKSKQEKLDNPSLYDQLHRVIYRPGVPHDLVHFNPQSDPGRIRYEPFFRKMYGNSKAAVETHLVTIYWMPHYFGLQYPLRVTTVNQVDQKFQQISSELEALVTQHPEYKVFLENPSGTYKWRLIAHTQRLSLHSFGMTIDLNADHADYWQWELQSLGRPITEDEPLSYRNQIPWPIVTIFEKHGFIWGGKWRHFDSMHFEYRPELLTSKA